MALALNAVHVSNDAAPFGPRTLGTGDSLTLQLAAFALSGSGTFSTPSGTNTFSGDVSLAADKSFTAAAGTGAFDFSNASGVFKTSTGAVTLGGDVSISGSKTFSTGTGAVTINGDTSFAGVAVTASGASSFDLSSGSGVFKTPSGAVTLGPGAITVSGNIASSGNVSFDYSGSTGTFKTPSGLSTVSGDLRVNGNLLLSDATKVVDLASEQVLVADNHMYLNSGYTTNSAQTGGLVVNYLPSATHTDVDGAFVAGVAATSNPTVVTADSNVFSAGDLIQISGCGQLANNGLFEVLSHTGTNLVIRGIGTSACAEDFTQNQFASADNVGGVITKVSVSVLRADSGGRWEVASGSSTGFSFINLARVTESDAISFLSTLGVSGQVDFASNLDASGGIDIDADNQSLTLGAGADLTLVHNGVNTVITSATGDLQVVNSNATGSTVLKLGSADSNTAVSIQSNTGAHLFDVQGGGRVVTASGAQVGPTGGNLLLGGGLGGGYVSLVANGSSEIVRAVGPGGGQKALLPTSDSVVDLGASNNAYLNGFIDNLRPTNLGADPDLAVSLYVLDGELYYRETTSGGSNLVTQITENGGLNIGDIALSLDDAYNNGHSITVDAGPVALTQAKLDEASGTLTISYSALNFTGTAHGIVMDMSGASSLSNGSDVYGVNLIGVANAGAGNSVGLRIASFDVGIENVNSLNQDGAADFSGGLTNSAGELLVSGGNVQLNDSIALTLGTGDDLSLSHNGTDSFITNATGALVISNSDVDDAIILKVGSSDADTSVSIKDSSNAMLLRVTGDGGFQTYKGTFDVNASGAVTIDSSAGTISIGGDAVNQNISLGTAGVRDVTVGSTTGASSLTLRGGSGGLSLSSTAGAVAVSIKDNASNVFRVAEGSNSYIQVDTTDGAEVLSLGGAAMPFIDLGGSSAGSLYSAVVGFTANAAENVTAGDVLYLTTSGTVGKADADAAGKKFVVGIAAETKTSGNAVRVASMPGQVITVNSDISALSRGTVVYMSKTAGALVSDLSSYNSPGDTLYRVGFVHTAGVAGSGKIMFMPQYLATVA